MELSAALASLPHGASFRFLDTLTALDPGKSVTGHYLLRGDEAFLPGHFPGAPLMPGVLLIEAVAQAGGVAAQTDPAIPPAAQMYLTAVRGAKITGSAVPGETLTITATVTARMGPLVQIEGTVMVGEKYVLKTQVTLSAA